jgi:hypothetical protein
MTGTNSGSEAVLAADCRRDHNRLVQLRLCPRPEFAADSSRLSYALKNLRVQGDSCALLDGVVEALHLLAIRDPARRRIILVIAEARPV